MKIRYSALIGFLLAVLLICTVSFAEGVPEGYPDIIEGLDFNGQTVYIYDWWSTGTRVEDPDQYEQIQYAYWDWLEETYHVHVIRTALSDWYGVPDELASMVENHDNSKLCIIAVDGGFAGTPLQNDLFMPWTYGLDQGVYSDSVVEYMTKGNTCYGVSDGSYDEPRQGVFFNKRILTEAGINWNDIYDAQAAGTWTWDKMEGYMDRVQQDTDNDGVLDIWALTGNADDITVGLIASNGADFYCYNDEGKLVPAADSVEFKEALSRRQYWDQNYLRPYENWDDYMQFWREGNVAFMIGQAYEGFNKGEIVNQVADDWGFVAVPKGPNADHYTNVVNNNVFGIPNVYDEATSLKLQKLYTLWTWELPEMKNSWADQYSDLTDERAIEETYAMLRDSENGEVMKYNLIGDRNSSINEIIWNLDGGTPDQIILDALFFFQGRCDVFNGDRTQEEVDAEFALIWGSYNYGFFSNTLGWAMNDEGTLYVLGAGDMPDFEYEEPAPWAEFSGDIQSVVIEDGVTSIGESAFYECENLTTVTMAGSVTRVGGSAFLRCTALEDVQLSNGLTEIGYAAFSECPSLTAIVLPGSLETLGEAAFADSGITSITVPADVETKTWHFFYPGKDALDHLYHITLPASITDTGYGTFCMNPLPYDAPDFVMPSDLTAIDEQAFSGTTPHFIWLSENVESISASAFAGCQTPLYVYVPYGCESVAPNAFPEGTVILGYGGYEEPTYIEQYAEDNGYTFMDLENPFSGNG